ncbi:MAG: lauroyl acyltransferase [Alphaproteobacteria bacterium]|nr:lauroyl acyltransferase [Alphaproteobacteria bacterium]
MACSSVAEAASPAHRAQALLARASLALLGALPIPWASALGAALGRLIGLCMRHRSREAAARLRRALPEVDARHARRLIGRMWGQLGRVAAELPHLSRLRFTDEPGGWVELVGREHLERLRDDGRAGIAYTAHLGNWELTAAACHAIGLTGYLIYRAPNNPLIDDLMRELRSGWALDTVPKGMEGARRLLRAIKAGAHIGMLVDQKMNDGIPVPFFGRPAMTAPALAQLALRYRLPVVGVRCERLKGARFRVTAYPPLPLPADGAEPEAVADLMAMINASVENWVRRRPEQWLWLHRRWPD